MDEGQKNIKATSFKKKNDSNKDQNNPFQKDSPQEDDLQGLNKEREVKK